MDSPAPYTLDYPLLVVVGEEDKLDCRQNLLLLLNVGQVVLPRTGLGHYYDLTTQVNLQRHTQMKTTPWQDCTLVLKCGLDHLNANARDESNANLNENAQHLNQMQMCSGWIKCKCKYGWIKCKCNCKCIHHMAIKCKCKCRICTCKWIWAQSCLRTGVVAWSHHSGQPTAKQTLVKRSLIYIRTSRDWLFTSLVLRFL